MSIIPTERLGSPEDKVTYSRCSSGRDYPKGHDAATSFDTSTGLEVRLEFVPSPLLAGQHVRWTVTVANRGSERRVITFASAQRADVALSAEGVECYRWSRDRLFAAVIEEREHRRGEEWSFTLEDTLAAAAGPYSLHASVSARPTLPPIRGEVVVRPGR